MERCGAHVSSSRESCSHNAAPPRRPPRRPTLTRTDTETQAETRAQALPALGCRMCEPMDVIIAARPTREWKAATVCGNAMGLTLGLAGGAASGRHSRRNHGTTPRQHT